MRVAAAGLCALGLAGIGFGAWHAIDSDAGVRWRRPVMLIAAGNPPESVMRDVEHHLREDLGFRVERLDAVELPNEALNRRRGQYDGYLFNRAIAQQHPDWKPKKIVALVIADGDLFNAKNPSAAFSFTVRHLDGIATVPLPRIDERFYGRPWSETLLTHRVRKLVDLNVGVLAFGLRRSPNPRSVLFKRLNSLDDVDRMREGFAPRASEAQRAWRAGADRACGTHADNMLAAIEAEGSGAPVRSRILRLTRRFLVLQDRLLRNLRALRAAPEDEETAREYLAAIDLQIRADRQLAGRLTKSWSDDTLRRGVIQSTRLGAQARSYALDLGAEVCANLFGR